MLENNQLTRIPSEIPLFPKLYELGLSVGNRITTVPSASLSFTAQVAYLFLNSIAINVIQPGAFQGEKIFSLFFKIVANLKLLILFLR